MTAEELIKLREELEVAVKSSVYTDYYFDGEDEVGYKTFDEDDMVNAIIAVLEKWKLI
jgi:hypothetical protein